MVAFYFLLITSFWAGYKIFTKRNVSKEIKSMLIYAMAASTWYNFNHNPHMVLYLCNLTALIAIYLTFKFDQRLFNVFFFFVWSGDLFTLLIIDNPVAPSLDLDPLFWLAFYFKHVGPILLVMDLIRNQKYFIEKHAYKHAMIFMLSYVSIMYVYDVAFDQNILDLQEATLDIEKAFGPWPNYVFANITIGLLWFWAIDLIGKKLKVIQN
ncbi:MAG: hypothetical protein HOK52_03405 [Candidatus Marinimicrobia bacterium]|jgi:hypothetical protein|nr:hypothetical protein [Candidatus Neomarinimicrobiota bacterium]MBT3938030.1 hypothetical protein [Candidatus Neomarinimicrobiota bacterium]MBT3961558.1 hypothetical protein [Candidatus Neomarinimicrobiota bacterium]MBT4382054.1 hypothetical protein [Candidatus Neomarinimicrobiota bacterium]MBT4636091.1 hypothetical protein [Candidatus Neomarinimicrobiota bacterium]